MEVIHKHILPPNMTVQRMQFQIDANILTVQKQGNQIVLWERHDEVPGPVQEFKVYAVFTGLKYPGGGHYLGTVQLESGLVLHYFIEEA